MPERTCRNCGKKFKPASWPYTYKRRGKDYTCIRISKAECCSKKCTNYIIGSSSRTPEAECKVSGCNEFGKMVTGLCRKHYQYWHNNGITEIPKHVYKKLPISDSRKMWLAGIIDCDGWIGLFKTMKKGKAKSYWAAVAIGNTNKKFIEFVHRIIGVGRVNLSRREPPNKDLYNLVINKHEDVQNTLYTISPYLVIKKRQAELLMTMPPKNYRDPKKKAEIKRQMTILNKKGC